MNTKTRNVIALGAAGALIYGAGAALATAPSGESVNPLAHGVLAKPANVNVNLGSAHVSLQTTGALNVLTMTLKLAPNGTGGWHQHAGPLISVVTRGTLTVIDAQCHSHVITAGHAMISPGTTPSKDENRGTSPVTVYVTFLLPRGVKSPRIDEPAPAGCSA